jgi:hypothetical protein
MTTTSSHLFNGETLTNKKLVVSFKAFPIKFIKSTFFCVFLLFSFFSSKAQTIFIEPVFNNIKVGAFEGNKNLAFGVKNIIEELINEGDSLSLIADINSAVYRLQVELIFFDIVTTNSGIGIFHEDKVTTIIRMKGILYKGDKKIKQVYSEGKSTEISTSTLIVDEGGNFNQQSASSAIKKTTQTLITKLMQ